ncbi:MAG: 23S rRNA (pseudouridine(1915)-N(3))-methyltransferase RlmH [Bacteroidales bacterium]|nr:23S rRNA (pseudouridine(1915)-N(3))-methyltransferase RlmH [Bacteroidales bacterium]
MTIRLVVVGKTEEEYLRKGIDIYLARLGHYCKFEMVTIPALKGVRSLGKEQLKEREAELILKNVAATDECILLDERGKEFTSSSWAQHLEQKFAHSSRNMVFVIGGSMGFGKKVYDRADSLMSLSKMTFSHQMVRLIFLEQLYRAFTIIEGEPYHHE